MAKPPGRDDTHWISLGILPTHLGFAPSEKAWNRTMKRLGVKGLPYPASAGCLTRFERDGSLTLIMTLGDAFDSKVSRVQVAALIAHEATHAKQMICEKIGETNPSMEFEAYLVQAIFQGLYQAWLDTRAPSDADANPAKDKAEG
jgi:hypothetical protein